MQAYQLIDLTQISALTIETKMATDPSIMPE